MAPNTPGVRRRAAGHRRRGRCRQDPRAVSGPVQGVGFRWNMQAFAEEAGIGGWVRNLPDGSTVEAELEGPCERVAQLIARMDAHYERFDAWFPSRFEVASWSEVPLQGDTAFTVRTAPMQP